MYCFYILVVFCSVCLTITVSNSLHIITFERLLLFNIHKEIQKHYNTRLNNEIENMKGFLLNDVEENLNPGQRMEYILEVLTTLFEKIIKSNKFANLEGLYRFYSENIKKNIVKILIKFCDLYPDDDKQFIVKFLIFIKKLAVKAYEIDNFTEFQYNEVKLVEFIFQDRIKKV